MLRRIGGLILFLWGGLILLRFVTRLMAGTAFSTGGRSLLGYDDAYRAGQMMGNIVAPIGGVVFVLLGLSLLLSPAIHASRNENAEGSPCRRRWMNDKALSKASERR